MPNQPKPDTARLELILPKQLKEAAQDAAESNGESVSAAVRWGLAEYIAKRAKEKK